MGLNGTWTLKEDVFVGVKCEPENYSQKHHAKEVKHLSEAKPYEAPNHRGYSSLRLFGLDAGGPKQFTVGLSHFLPGGGAGPDASPTEKVYYMLAGELTLIAGGKQTVLKANDACFIGPNESREIVNRGNEVVTMLVAVSTPQK